MEINNKIGDENMASEDEKRLNDMILNIIEKRGHYGTVKITKKKMSNKVIWIGTNGYTASVGQWIRVVTDKVEDGLNPTYGYRWFTVVNIDKTQVLNKDYIPQCMWYFGIELESDTDSVIYVCGGTTDFSGEGGRGRKLANHFLTRYIPENMIIERNADYLITLLTEK